MTAQIPRTRLFTNEYVKGDKVAIIRERHGWHDGHTHGVIAELTTHEATVTTEEGGSYHITHPRDIRKL